MPLPAALETLIAEFGKLPGIGRRSAERIAFALLASDTQRTASLSRALDHLHEQIGHCEICGYFTEASVCPICSDRSREHSQLCVVETALDVVAFERAGGFRGLYHVLGGALSPLKGITPEDLEIDQLRRRVEAGEITEVILATSPSVEGDVTALYVHDLLIPAGVSLTRIGRGLPMGGSLEHADSGTLRMALEGRRNF